MHDKIPIPFARESVQGTRNRQTMPQKKTMTAPKSGIGLSVCFDAEIGDTL